MKRLITSNYTCRDLRHPQFHRVYKTWDRERRVRVSHRWANVECPVRCVRLQGHSLDPRFVSLLLGNEFFVAPFRNQNVQKTLETYPRFELYTSAGPRQRNRSEIGDVNFCRLRLGRRYKSSNFVCVKSQRKETIIATCWVAHLPLHYRFRY